jgi:antitoxin MazE
MTTKVQKSGNCLSINIPKALAAKANITKGSKVSFDFKAGKILVIPEEKKETLADLLKGLTPENRHELVDWGPDVGREIIEPYEAISKKRRRNNI